MSRLPAICTTFFLLSLSLAFARRTCKPGSFRDGTRCRPCPPGTYQDERSKDSCEPCPAGRFRANPGAKFKAECLLCPADTFSKEGASSCTNCPKRTASLIGFRACGKCGPGFGLDRFSNSPCGKCHPGYFSDQKMNRECKPCPEGTITKRPGATSCTKCPKGTFRRFLEFDSNPFERDNICFKCQEGTFNDEEGAVACKLCPTGTFSRKGAESCTPCPKGTFSRFILSTKCKPCPRGTTSKGIRPAGCSRPGQDCPIDTFKSKSGECQSCLPGERLDEATKECVACVENEVSKGGVDTVCRRCPPGKVPLNSLSRFERSECECKPPTVDDGSGGCELCPVGTFWERIFGFSQAIDGFAREDENVAADCEGCGRGFFNDKKGMTSCKRCSLDEYQDEFGATKCKRCAPGFSSRLDLVQPVVSRDRCFADDTGCRPGEKKTKNGCNRKQCILDDGQVLIDRKPCRPCGHGNRVDPNSGKCVPCGDQATFSLGRVKNSCSQCPNNAFYNIFNMRCGCNEGFEEFKGKCRKCSAGFASKGLPAGGAICARCPPGSISESRGNRIGTSIFRCIECEFKFLLENSIPDSDGTKCIPCPDGTVIKRDVFGRAENECVPSSSILL